MDDIVIWFVSIWLGANILFALGAYLVGERRERKRASQCEDHDVTFGEADAPREINENG